MRESHLDRMKRALLELELFRSEEDFPGQIDERRREIIIDAAMHAADEIVMEGSNGTVEETDWLTSAVAMKWQQKVHCAMTGKLLRKQILGDKE